MTRLRECLVTGAALGLLGIGAVGCTGQETAAPTSTPTSTPTSAPSAGGTAAAAYEQRVKDALDTISPDDPEFRESGTDRLAEGVHHYSTLTKGSAYQVAFVCAGEGTIAPVVGGEKIPAVACDGVPVTHRIASAPVRLPLTVPGLAGATGSVGWRIVAVTD
ncbi:hypothetical protein ACIO8G_28525 [Streptomyces sp. NPDC087219]|uniref:hypothetical protein n=1 Tax=Streptomyces sp. NPDC087219 TaxID=3365770 RepID=UPI003802C574